MDFWSFWGVLGGPGEGLGHSWAPLGASRGVLAASWGVLGGLRPAWVHFSRFKFNVALGIGPWVAISDAERTQDGTQNGTQNAQKSIKKMKMKKDALEDRLGAILKPSWADLEPLRSPKSCSRLGRGSFFLNLTLLKK